MADAKTMPPLPPVDGYGARPEGHYSADQMREYARAYAAAPQPADVPHDVVEQARRGFDAIADMITNCSGVPTEPDSLPQMVRVFAEQQSAALATPAPSTSTEEALRAENARLREALEPFAEASKRFDEAAVKFNGPVPKDEQGFGSKFTHADIRRARSALSR